MTTRIKTNRWAAGCALLLAGACSSMVSASTLPLLMEYQFNETGTTAVNGVAGGAALNLKVDTTSAPIVATSTDLHGASGSGVTGKPGDRALNLTMASGMGSNANTNGDPTTARPVTDASPAAIDQLKSFTLTGWFKTDTSTNPNQTFNAYAHLFDFRYGGQASYLYGFELQATDGRVSLVVNGKTSATQMPRELADAGKWFFLAVSYDGTATSNNVKVYRGYLDDAARGTKPLLALVATQTIDAGTVATNLGKPTSALMIGNSDYSTRPFDGYIDGVKIFGSKTDNSGALSLTQLETVRGSIIPEPASLGLVAVGATLLLGRSRR